MTVIAWEIRCSIKAAHGTLLKRVGFFNLRITLRTASNTIQAKFTTIQAISIFIIDYFDIILLIQKERCDAVISIFIACIIAVICAIGFITIWFTTVYTEVSAKQKCLADLNEQLRFHEELYSKAVNSPDALSAEGIMKTSRILCNEASKGYNRILQKPMNRIPALMMGFRTVEMENKQDINKGAST